MYFNRFYIQGWISQLLTAIYWLMHVCFILSRKLVMYNRVGGCLIRRPSPNPLQPPAELNHFIVLLCCMYHFILYLLFLLCFANRISSSCLATVPVEGFHKLFMLVHNCRVVRNTKYLFLFCSVPNGFCSYS